MVTAIRNGHWNMSSNPIQGYLHFTVLIFLGKV